MSFKTAIASSNGETIDNHFGSSRQFYIYQVDEEAGNFFLLEKRTFPEASDDQDLPFEELSAASSCSPGGCGPSSSSSCQPSGSHGCGGSSGGGREEAARLVSDCKTVLAARIGRGGELALAKYGIQALEISGSIDDALNKLINFYKKVAQRRNPSPSGA